MAFPEDHENLNAADAAAPATRQSTSWAANIHGLLVKVVAAVKSVGAQTKANKATIEDHDTSIAGKAEDDFSNIDTPEATKNLLAGPLSQSDIGKTIKLRGTVAAPELAAGDADTIGFSAVLYTGWVATFLEDGGSIQSRQPFGGGVIERCAPVDAGVGDGAGIVTAMSNVPNNGVIVGAERTNSYNYTKYANAAGLPTCTTSTATNGKALRVKYRTYST